MIVYSIYFSVALALVVGIAAGFVAGSCWEHGRKNGSYDWRHRARKAEAERDTAISQRNKYRDQAAEDAELSQRLVADVDRLAAALAKTGGKQ